MKTSNVTFYHCATCDKAHTRVEVARDCCTCDACGDKEGRTKRPAVWRQDECAKLCARCYRAKRIASTRHAIKRAEERLKAANEAVEDAKNNLADACTRWQAAKDLPRLDACDIIKAVEGVA